MSCYHPLSGWYSRRKTKAGKRKIVFDPEKGNGESLQVPCQQCIGCRLDKAAEWAARLMHETLEHEDNRFLTLTYDEDHLPTDGSLVKHHVQDFMKRLRWHYRDKRIRFYACGEYGEQLSRPHYHVALFGLRFEDERPIYLGADMTESAILDLIWKHGHCVIGNLTWESAGYIARYVTKKQTGERKWTHYVNDQGVCLQEEFALMSRHPGIGKRFFERYSGDVFPADEIIVNGRPRKPPRYYDKLLERAAPGSYADMKLKRKDWAKRMEWNNTPARLRVREIVKLAQTRELRRNYETPSL